MSKKYLDDSGLLYFWSKLKTSFAPYTHKSRHATGQADALAPSDIGALPIAGGTMTGALVAQTNTNYTTKQMRNVIMSTSDAVLGSMADGDIWIKYV